MAVEVRVPFDEVRGVFLQQNPDPAFRSTRYALGLLEAADRRFGSWFKVTLSSEDVPGVMLPPHREGDFELIPPSGLRVSEVVSRVDLLPPVHVCRQRIEDVSRDPLSAVFLSATPLDDPAYSDYRDLVKRGYKGLTHLDGLHRLIAWARLGSSGITAYVAGIVGP